MISRRATWGQEPGLWGETAPTAPKVLASMPALGPASHTGGQSLGSAAFSDTVAHLLSPGNHWRQALRLPCLLCPWPQGPAAPQRLRPAQPAVLRSVGLSGGSGAKHGGKAGCTAGSVVCSKASCGREWALSRWPPCSPSTACGGLGSSVGSRW